MGVTVIKGHAAFFIFCIISKANHQAALNKYMNRLKKNQHTATFTSFKGCGKSILLLDLIEREHNKHFDYSIIIYPTLR